jgi:uncharacterized membrane protein
MSKDHPQTTAMSRCQRIGILVSILWLVGFLSFLYIDANRSHSEVFEHCLNSASTLSESTDRKSFQQICARAFEASRETPGKIVKEVSSDKILWAAIVVPLGLLWIVGGLLSYAVRRISKTMKAALMLHRKLTFKRGG